MKRLLSDYRFSEVLRYEAHTLIYTPAKQVGTVEEKGNSLESQAGTAALHDEHRFQGIMAAAVLAALLADTDEGDERGIELETAEQREAFFVRYEQEVRQDNGGLFSTETHALTEAYMEIVSGDDVLMGMCGNERLCDLALGLVLDYMHRLTLEQTGEQIYDIFPFREPFAQWLYDAGFIESRRQYLLSINWAEPSEVYALDEMLSAESGEEKPTYVFEGTSSEHIMKSYFEWLWGMAQQQTSAMPDAEEQLAELVPQILSNETLWNFLKEDLDKLSVEEVQSFRKWMAKWKVFITDKLSTSEEQKVRTSNFRARGKQRIFKDNYLECPKADDVYPYSKVREYIRERCRYDEQFKILYFTMELNEFCEQLSGLFGWVVDDNALGKSIRRRPIK